MTSYLPRSDPRPVDRLVTAAQPATRLRRPRRYAGIRGLPRHRPTGIAGAGGTPANHLDQTTIAHLPGHKTAKAISASNADAESR